MVLTDENNDGVIDEKDLLLWFSRQQPLWERAELFKVHVPQGYTEGSLHVARAKAIGFAAVAFSLYFGVLDQLATLDKTTFVPCNDHQCHYWQLFGNENLPGSGVDFMEVENGIYRPFSLDDVSFDVFTTPFEHEKDEFGKHQEALDDIEATEQKACDSTKYSIAHVSFWITKIPLRLVAMPFSLAARVHEGDAWGMQNIRPALCKNMTATRMRKVCEHNDVKKKINNHMDSGFSQYAVVFCLGMWAASRAVHDVMLLHDNPRVSEVRTLKVSFFSVFWQGLATAAVFFWAMGAMSVFTAKPFDNEECQCYYQLPTLQSHIALATPFALLFDFAARVQAFGMACLYGDSVTFMTFSMPQYLARQSMLWSWLTLASPVVSGTIEATEKRQKFTKEEWADLLRLHKHLGMLRVFTTTIVALAACPFVVRYKEVMTGMVSDGWVDAAWWRLLLMKAILLAPSVIVAVLALDAIKELSEFSFNTYGNPKTISENMSALLPDSVMDTSSVQYLKDENRKVLGYTLDRWLGMTVCGFGSLIILTYAAAVGHGLCPDASLLFGNTPRPPSLAQAGLWGSCGFVFVTLLIMRVLNNVFAIYDDSVLLQHKAKLDTPRSMTISERDDQQGPLLSA